MCAALIASVMAFSACQGLTYPLLGLIMERNGENAVAIAINAAMTPLGIIISAPVISRYAFTWPRGPSIAASIAFVIVILLLIGATLDLRLWLILRFLLGCGANAIYVLSEASLLAIAPEAYRGRLVGAYTSVTTFGYAAGPLILSVCGSEGFEPFIITSLLLSLAMVPFLLVKIKIPTIEAEGRDKAASILRFLLSGGLLVLAYGSTTLFDNGFMSLLPSFGLRSGLTETEISFLLFMLMLGGTAFQIPIGWAVDRSSSFFMIVVCVVIGIMGFSLFSVLSDDISPLTLVAFFLGGAVLGVQTITLSELGRTYEGPMLLAGNASLSLTWGVSSIIGVPLAGYGIEILGPDGLTIIIGAVFTAFCLAYASQLFICQKIAKGHRKSGCDES
jgi:MFS family permease